MSQFHKVTMIHAHKNPTAFAASDIKVTVQWLDLLFLFVLCGIAYFLLLGSHALLLPDEGRYAEVARAMLANHDLILPRLNGVVFLDKPILFYWLQALAMFAFGVNEWAVRFWPAMLGVIGVLFTYITALKIFNSRQAAWYSAGMLASSPLYFFAAHYVNMDLAVAVFITSALYSFLLFVKFPAERKRWLLFFYLSMALAFLTKGLIGIVLPGMVVGMWILLLRRWSYLRLLQIGQGLLLLACCCVPWLFLAQKQNSHFLHYFFVDQQWQRYLARGFNNEHPFWFYLPVVLLGFMPWSFYVGAMLSRQLAKLRVSVKHAEMELFLLLWAGSIFVFFSVPASKIVGYIIPVLPPLVLLSAQYFSQLTVSQQRRYVRWAGWLLTPSMLVIAIALWYLPTSSYMQHYDVAKPLHNMSVVLACLTLVLAIISYYQRFRQFIIFLVAGNVLLSVFALAHVASLDVIDSNKSLAMQLKQYASGQDVIVGYENFYIDVPFYLQRNIYFVSDWHDPLITRVDNWRHDFYKGLQFSNDARHWLLDMKQLQQVWRSEQRVYLLVAKADWLGLQKDLTVRGYVMAANSRTLLVSNQQQK